MNLRSLDWLMCRIGASLRLAVACVLCFATSTATGSPISSFAVGIEARATNNALLAPSDERNDTIYLPEASIGLKDQWDLFELEAEYRFQARRFRRDSFPDDQIITGSTGLAIDVVPARYRVTVTHERQQNLEDPQLAGTPFNQVETDAVSVAHALTLLSSSRSSLALTGGFTTISGALPADESDRISLDLDFSHQLDSRTSLGVAVEFLDVDFDLGTLPDYERWSVLARAGRTGRNWSLELGIGRNELEREGFASSGGLLADFSFEWQPTARTTARISATNQFTDQTAEGGLVGIDPDAFLTPAEFDGLVFEDTTADISLTHARERLSLFATLGVARQDFEDSDDEQQTNSASVGLAYNLTRTFSVNSALRWSTIEFEGGFVDGSREDDQRLFELGIAWEPGSRTQLSLTLLDETRDSSDPGTGGGAAAGGFFIYDERAIVFRLNRSLL